MRQKEPATHLHTKVLLNYLEHARRCGGSYSPAEQAPGTFYTVDELKHALKSRPHVPNKPEARKIRQFKGRRHK